ncbi:acyl-CoA dehydrogenase family protein [Saccharibacter sp. 17.LH.SD]|uniref:acyl-CoA dehydrogenase family protein n=1 Tax=Saccharibacter sp. 17.LH.SD TaxID=2689393 RepID=UPI001F196F70|nr:acyl-CoA dehydrogenase family protein [Saccharibacter sp. 17.LH.SD]
MTHFSSRWHDHPALDALVKQLSERAPHYDRVGEIAFENIEILRNAGYFSLAVPKEYGGGGISFYDMTVIVEKIAKGDPSTALILAMQYLHTTSIATSPTWPPTIREEILLDIFRHGSLINALRVEPDLGTPSRGGIPHTRLTRAGKDWHLTGQKIFSTGSSALRWGLVWCATDETPQRVGQVLVRLDQPGISIEKSWHHLGMRATGSDTFIFQKVKIPDRHLVNVVSVEEGNPETPDLSIWHALLLSHLYNAIAHSARDWFISFLHKRTPSGLGKPLATLPRFHTIVGEIDSLLLSNTALLDHAHKADISLPEASQIKRLVTEQAIKAVNRAIEVTGNPGLDQNNPLERHYRNVLCGRIHSPQGDTVLETAGRLALQRS